MKIRYGFVSNSSSSSFCIYGFTFNNEEEFKDNLTDEARKTFEEKYSESLYEMFRDPQYKEFSLNYVSEDHIAIGRSYLTLGDEETGRQFMESVEKVWKPLFKEGAVEFDGFEEGWMDC